MAKQLSNRGKRRQLLRSLAKSDPKLQLSPIETLTLLKYSMSLDQADSAIKNIPLNDRQKVLGIAVPHNFTDLRKYGSSYSNYEDIDKEFGWYAHEIKRYSNIINAYLRVEESFENAFLLGEYGLASKILRDFEMAYGVSQWLIEKRLQLAEYTYGFEKNKEVLSKIVNVNNAPATNILARHVSTRLEKNLSNYKYHSMLTSYLELYTDATLIDYLTIKLNYFSKFSHSNKAFILRFENSSSIIDRYRTVIAIALSIVSDEDEKKNITYVSSFVEYLKGSVSDLTLSKISYAIGNTPGIALDNHNKRLLKVIDAYVNEDFSYCISEISKLLPTCPQCIELYEIFVKCHKNLGIELSSIFPDRSLAAQILTLLNHIVAKDDQTSSSLIELRRIYSSLGDSRWTYSLFKFVNTEYSIYKSSYSYHRHSYLFSSFFNPYLGLHISNEVDGTAYLQDLNNCQKSIMCIVGARMLEAIHLKNENFFSASEIQGLNRYRIYLADILQRLDKHKLAIAEFNILISELSGQKNSFHIVHQLIHDKLISYILLEEYVSALQLIAESNIKYPNALNKLRYDIVIERACGFEDTRFVGNICTPIMLHQYQVNANDIWIAFDNFLHSLNVNYPHELRDISHLFPLDSVVYFLKYVCKQDVYYSSYLYSNQDDLDNERIEICVLLAELDSQNIEEYFNEITEISRNLLIRRGVKQIDESKIYVDVKGIKKVLQTELKESFVRSLNLLNIPIDQIEKIEKTSSHVIIPYLSKVGETRGDTNYQNIKLTSYSRFEIFVEMFYKIRDKFIASNEFGIDTYVSMRIRHGTLLGEIRSVFESFNLITKMDSSSGQYLENEFWTRKFQFREPTTVQTFTLIMMGLSSKIDEITDEIKNKKLQIRTENKVTGGLFDYSYTEAQLLTMFKNSYADVNDYDVFFDNVIDDLWQATERNLEVIRNYFTDTVKPEIVTLLREVLSGLEAAIKKTDYPVLNELIRDITSCMTAISTEFDKISQWFKRTNNKTINDFYFSLPVDASLTTIRRMYPSFSEFSPEIVIVSETIFEGEHFPQFTDILQILLHNVIKHSQLLPKELFVNFHISESKGILTISVRNNVSKSADIMALNSSIQNARVLLTQNTDNEIIRKEGGSGYLKILKILKTDLQRNSAKIELSDISESREFRSTITFETANLQKREHYEISGY